MGKPLLEVKNLSKSYGTQVVLNDLSFQISEGSKIALIGRNGAGKTTLLKIILDGAQADKGSVSFFDWTRLGVIHQNEVLPSDTSTLNYLESVGGKPSWEVKKLGVKFGLGDEYLEKPPAELSGGYQMRVKLVAMFLQEPNLLFLDEPVNYLDLQTLLLLENVLHEYRGSFVLVAHDRTFLQNTCDTVYEIERGVLTAYKGRVQEYLDWKAEQFEFAKRTNKKLKREIQHNQAFIDRFGAKKNLASRAQNKAKHISKLRAKIMKIDPSLVTTNISIFASPIHPGNALRVTDISIGYYPLVVASDISFEISRGEKVVIVGENGRGKSTLLKTLVGKIEPLDGTLKWWKNASVGYYDQLTSESLVNKDTVLSHLARSAPNDATPEKILMMAGNFLFRGDDLDKNVSVLSGGERARLALAGVLLQSHNVLVLDEPTNHMDVETSDGLALALKKYTGTVIFVSHARTFVSELAGRILEVKHGSVREYNGSYDDHVEEVAALMDAAAHIEDEGVKKERVLKSEDRLRRAEEQAKLKEFKRSLKRIEKQITELESEKGAIMKYFFDNPTDYAPPKALRLEEIKKLLSSLEKDWIVVQEGIDTLSNN
jgi:ATP-binding cassette, subfamily F, member 3